MKKWKCTVCGYIHNGDEPPEECPMCGADRSEFVEITVAVETQPDSEEALPDEVLPEEEAAVAGGVSPFDRLTDLMLQNHLHPISVHTPNGIVPAAVTFLALSYIFQLSGFELAAFYNQFFVLLVMPLVLFSGFIEWRKHYKGAKTSVFFTKIACGVIVFTSLLVAVLWRIIDPDVAAAQSASRWMYFLVHVIALGAVGLAGHLGGKLVFGRSKK